MLLRILAVGTKMPAWVTEGYEEYSKRFPKGWTLELCEIPAEKRSKNADIPRIIATESDKITKLIKPLNYVVALDIQGRPWTTTQLAHNLETWSHDRSAIDFLIGGPDGLSKTCLETADIHWSLSPLTLPHPLVRIMLAEQLYRGLSILQNHPYHR